MLKEARKCLGTNLYSCLPETVEIPLPFIVTGCADLWFAETLLILKPAQYCCRYIYMNMVKGFLTGYGLHGSTFFISLNVCTCSCICALVKYHVISLTIYIYKL